MFHYKVKIAYKGTHYHGWQIQTNDSPDTVQNIILQVLRRLAKYEKCQILGASRTDTGVHALGQVGKISLPRYISPENLQKGLNSLLPRDIRIFECTIIDERFDPTRDAIGKEYHYYFSNEVVENPQLVENIFYLYDRKLNIELMKECCGDFVGTHDFYNFTPRSSNALTTIRTVSACEIVSVSSFLGNSKIYCFKIEGNGFLKQMIRYLVGTLFELGGKEDISIDRAKKTIQEYLREHKQDKLAVKAKALGLYLVNVKFKS